MEQSFPGNDERMSVLHQDSGGIGKSIPSALEIFLGRGFCTPRPSGFPSGFALGKSLGSRGAKPTASENLSDFPWPSRFPSGFALGKFLGFSGNLSGVGDGFPNTSLVLVEHGYNHQYVILCQMRCQVCILICLLILQRRSNTESEQGTVWCTYCTCAQFDY